MHVVRKGLSGEGRQAGKTEVGVVQEEVNGGQKVETVMTHIGRYDRIHLLYANCISYFFTAITKCPTETI